MIFVCALFSALILIPKSAYAWGGGVHLQIGLNILSNLQQLPPETAILLAAHPLDYLYGCIAADITLGKKFTHYLLNCHRWSVGKKILLSAETSGERACALGYLSHLAADVVAHNYFVPYRIMLSFNMTAKKHTYWEMRFETFVKQSAWDHARAVCSADQRANDVMLRNVITPTIFSFGVNKKIFNSIMLLSRLEKWRALMRSLPETSYYALSGTDKDEYMKMTEEAVIDFLQHPDESELLLAEPTGEHALAMAETFRRNLRLLYKNGKITKEDGLRQAETLKKKLLNAMCQPEELEELHSRRLEPRA